MMKKMSLLVAGGIGYVLGTRAGRERYEQINSWIQQARESDAVTAATARARETLDDLDLSGTISNN